jgi:hypothetical protein
MTSASGQPVGGALCSIGGNKVTTVTRVAQKDLAKSCHCFLLNQWLTRPVRRFSTALGTNYGDKVAEVAAHARNNGLVRS